MSSYICLKQQKQSLGIYSIVPLRYEDRFHIMKWRNEQIYHLRQARPLTEDDQQCYFDNVVSKLFDNPKPDQILFSYLKNNYCIGYGGLVHVNWIDQNAEISFIMDTSLESEHFSEYWSYYLTMLREVAFKDLSLHKIYTYAFDLRPHLYKVLEDNGFVREATLKEHCLFGGVYRDVVLHALWNDFFDIINYVDCSVEQKREILSLRNRDDVRIWMVNSKFISEEDHFKFVESLKEDVNKLYFAIYKDGKLMGTYNLTNNGNGVWERGIIANPSTQGTGLTEKWESQIIKNLSHYKIQAISAKVKSDNPRSLRYHEKMGFQVTNCGNGYIYYLKRL